MLCRHHPLTWLSSPAEAVYRGVALGVVTWEIWEMDECISQKSKVVLERYCTKMDIIFRLNKQNHKVAAQARRLNKVATRILDEKIFKLENSHQSQTKTLQRETENIEVILQELNDTPRTYRTSSTCSSGSWDDDFVLSSVSDQLSASNANMKSTVRGQLGCSCRYNVRKNKSECKYFPCRLPETYQTLGFQSYPKDYTSLSNYEELSHRSRPQTAVSKSLATDRCIDSTTRLAASPRLTVKDKIRGLNIYVKEMKDKHAKTKPRAWEVRYGEPIPRRFLLKTAVPVR